METKRVQIHLEDTLKYLKEILSGSKLSAEDILVATASLMEFVKEFPELKGEEKKMLVQMTIKNYINEMKVKDEKDRVLINLIFDKMVPIAIDLLVDASKGKFKFKHIRKIFPCC